MANLDRLTTEEQDLRRRARRRLVGAIALVLLAVVVLPMLFNPEPKPLGPSVDIRIPDQSTPFRPGISAPVGEPSEAADALQPSAAQTSAEASTVDSALAARSSPPVTMPRQTPPPPHHGVAPGIAKPAPVAGATDAKPVAASEPFATRGYYLQLGAFTNAANARQLAEKARAAGFDVVVQEVGGQVRVRMGPYAERNQALEVQARLRAKGFAPILLGS